MKPGITIANNKLIYSEYPSEKIGLAKFCDSFEIEINAIIAIAISPRLAIDNEELFILLITDDLKILPMPSNVLTSPSINRLERLFGLNSIMEEWTKFEYEDHYAKHDMIIFPEELYQQELFKNDMKLRIRKLFGGFTTKNFSGNFIERVKALTKK